MTEYGNWTSNKGGSFVLGLVTDHDKLQLGFKEIDCCRQAHRCDAGSTLYSWERDAPELGRRRSRFLLRWALQRSSIPTLLPTDAITYCSLLS